MQRTAHHPIPPTEQTRWFAEEVQPHEPALRAYLQSRFPTLADHDDLVRETYTRLLRAKDPAVCATQGLSFHRLP